MKNKALHKTAPDTHILTMIPFLQFFSRVTILH